jgi:hypothetical protein
LIATLLEGLRGLSIFDAAIFRQGLAQLVGFGIQLLKLTHKIPKGAMEPGRVLPYLREKVLSDSVLP